MAKRTKIVSFDDAKNASRQRRAQMRAEENDRYSGARPDPLGLSGNPSYASFLDRYSKLESEARYRDEAYDEWDDAPVNARVRRFDGGREYAEEDRQPEPAPMSKRERRRREKAKMRADKLFDRQVETSASRSRDEEGPRAALYEGKMGASHRRSARMQAASSALPQTAKLNPAGWFSNMRISPRSLKVGTALLCLILVGVFLYVPTQQYYQSVREHDRLVAEYEVVSQRNAALESQNESLTSNAGMEDAVRQKYGYVVEGDETAIVTGLSDTATDTSRDSEDIEANVLASSVKAPEEWYTPFLDALFGVS